MTIELTSTDTERLIAILAGMPELRTESGRVIFMTDVLNGSPRQADLAALITYGGPTRLWAIGVLNRLTAFGHDRPGHAAICLLLERLPTYIGDDGPHDFVRGLQARCGQAEPPAAPPPTPEPDGAKGKAEPPDAGSRGPVLNSGQAWAVLAGIDRYFDSGISPLSVCVADVTAIRDRLTAGYEATRLMTDRTPDLLPTRNNILAELSNVSRAAGAGDLLLFYFSGHGIYEDGESYLLPADARASALVDTAVPMRRVRKLMDQSPARAKVVIIDACQSGGSIGKAPVVMSREFIQRVFEEAQGMAVLLSCSPGERSWEWPEKRRSVFTHFLLEAIGGKADRHGKGFVTVSDANQHVTNGVKKWAVENGRAQTPMLQYAVSGDIMLAKTAGSGE